MNILNQYKRVKQNIEDYSVNIPANLIVLGSITYNDTSISGTTVKKLGTSS